MLDSIFTMTMTTGGDLCKPRVYWIGHGGHGGHGVFTHTYARACERTHLISIFYLIMLLPNVCKNTMTTMTSMTIVVFIGVVAVTVGGHGKKQGDQNSFKVISNTAGM